MVEGVLGDLGHDARAARLASRALTWRVTKGSAAIVISLIRRGAENRLVVRSPVLTLPPAGKRQALFQYLLQLNVTELHGAAFGIDGTTVEILGERGTLDLDPSEVRDLISRVQHYADEYDDKLASKYGTAKRPAARRKAKGPARRHKPARRR